MAAFHQRDQIGLQPHHDRLGFRVAHAAVEFQHLGRAVGADHDAGVEKAGVADAVGRHAFDGRMDHLAHDARVQFGRDHRRRRIRAHAAGVGAAVAVAQPLVILARRQRQHVLAVDHDDEAGFFAEQAFLDHHAMAGFAHAVAGEHGVDGSVRLISSRRDHHALARRQAVGLHHDGGALLVDIGVGGGGIGEGAEGRGGNAVARHELLGEILGAFQLGGRLGRAENPQSGGAKGIDHARCQRRFGADHGERDVAVAADELKQRRESQVSGTLTRPSSVAVPPLPGATNTWETRGDCASFHASACSRPPEPMTRIFISGGER